MMYPIAILLLSVAHVSSFHSLTNKIPFTRLSLSDDSSNSDMFGGPAAIEEAPAAVETPVAR